MTGIISHPTNEYAKCMTCERPIDRATCTDGHSRPEVGDLSVCAYCCIPSQFDKDFNLEPLTKEEIENIKETEPELWANMEEALEVVKKIRNYDN